MLSIIIPSYNEATKIAASLQRVVKFFRNQEESFELIVVNDGSKDQTLTEIKRTEDITPEIRIVTYEENRGKGFALRTGIAESSGEQLLFFDADLSTEPEEWHKLRSALASGADIAIGSRRQSGAQVLEHQPWWREAMGKVFTWLANFILFKNQHISDVTCGFKAFRGDVARDLFARQKLNDWSFDAEILYLAQKSGYSIIEVPVVWRDDPNTKVRPIIAAWTSFIGLLKIRWNSTR